MLFGDSDSRLTREKQYRRELKQEIEQKKSRVIDHAAQSQKQQPSQLLFIGAKTEEARRQKGQNYAQGLKEQIQIERQRKLQQKQLELERQKREDQKIKEYMRITRERYQAEKAKEEGRQRPVNTNSPPTPVKVSSEEKPKNYSYTGQMAPEQSTQERNQLRQVNQYQQRPIKDEASYLQRLDRGELQSAPAGERSYESLSFKNIYYRQLLGQRSTLENETASLTEFNRQLYLYSQPKRAGSKGLDELKQLQRLFEEKNLTFANRIQR